MKEGFTAQFLYQTAIGEPNKLVTECEYCVNCEPILQI